MRRDSSLPGDARRSVPWSTVVGLVACLLGGSLALGAAAAPREGGGLQGMELKATGAGGATTLGSILGDILRQGTAKGPGKILSVKVLEDQPEVLTLLVRYADAGADGMSLTATATERGRRGRRISEASTKLAARAGEATLKLEIAPEATGDVEVHQAVLNVSLSGMGRTEASAAYDCPKTWRRGGAGGVDGVIQAVPIGKALPEAPSGVVGPGTAPRAGLAAPGGLVIARSDTLLRYDRRILDRVLAQPTVTGPAPEAAQKGARGPGLETVPLLELLSVDPRVPLSEDDLGLPRVIQDVNKQSGCYYFLPTRYYLDWSQDRGHDFSMVYNAAKAEGSTNTVQMSAQLTAGLDPNDLAFLRDRVIRYCSKRGVPFTELLPFPRYTAPEVTLGDAVGRLYDIKKDQISVTQMSSGANYARISFVTDPITKENIQLALTGKDGLNGDVLFVYNGEGGGKAQTQAATVHLNLADEHSFGPARWTRDEPFRNVTPYPAKLKYLRILTNEQYSGIPTIYTYDLKNTVLRTGASAKIRGIPDWINTSSENTRMWVEYLVEKDETAVQKVLAGITSGVTSVARAELSIRTLAFAQELNVAAVVIKVSSRYFDAKGTEEAVKTLDISKEGSVSKIAPLYLVKRQPGEGKPGDPLLRYKLQVILQDGSMKESKEWTELNDLNLFIGKAQVKPVLEQP